MRKWEHATWATGQTEAAVIDQVGRIVARRALCLTRPGQRIILLAGKGHNGDDARAAKKYLPDREAILIEITDPKTALSELDGALHQPCHLIIDGLFGTGLNRTLDQDWQDFIGAINQTRTPILSIDVPSGLNADTGATEGAAVRATVTLSLGAIKRGLLAPGAWPLVGRLELAAEIGLSPCPHREELQWIQASDFSHFPPRRPAAGHKGSFGHLVIIAGSAGYHGAAVLAANAATRAQPGLVTLWTQTDVLGPVSAQLQSPMVDAWRPGLKLPDSCTALMFGPGLAAESLPGDLKNELQHFWRELPLPVVVDASALSWIPEGLPSAKSIRVLTPHPGEAARLMQCTTAAVQADRPAALRKLSRRFGNCWVILKGHQTLIGTSAGHLFVNGSGNPFLAQGGSGDVLAGYLGGLLAQPLLQSDPALSLCFGVWQHGATADRLSRVRRNWTTQELAVEIGMEGAKE